MKVEVSSQTDATPVSKHMLPSKCLQRALWHTWLYQTIINYFLRFGSSGLYPHLDRHWHNCCLLMETPPLTPLSSDSHWGPSPYPKKAWCQSLEWIPPLVERSLTCDTSRLMGDAIKTGRGQSGGEGVEGEGRYNKNLKRTSAQQTYMDPI